MIADQKDFITPHITDSHTLDYPCLHSGFVCEYELPHWNPIHIGRFALDISPTRHVVMLWIAALLCIITTLLALRAHQGLWIANVGAQIRRHLARILKQAGKRRAIRRDQRVLLIEDVEMNAAVIGVDDDLDAIADVIHRVVAQI